MDGGKKKKKKHLTLREQNSLNFFGYFPPQKAKPSRNLLIFGVLPGKAKPRRNPLVSMSQKRRDPGKGSRTRTARLQKGGSRGERNSGRVVSV